MGLFNKKKKNVNVDKEQNTQIDIRKGFEANLKYISSTEKDVDVIRGQFVKSDTVQFLIFKCQLENIQLKFLFVEVTR